MSILIGADLVPTESNQELFASGNMRSLLGQELLNILQDADYRIFNLEVPLTDRISPIPKCGPNLVAPENTVAGYKTIGADVLTLANNHIMDQDVQGLETTCLLLKENGIAYLGAGDNLRAAAKTHTFRFMDKTVGIYACAEREFSIADEKTPGANPFDPLESLGHISSLKEQCDYVIVLYHGGKEHYRYPSPQLQKTCRKIVGSGADLVGCQHSHCIGCREKYGNGVIVYGQGNFLFDHSKSEFWQTSLLISLNEQMEVSYIPLTKKGNSVRLAQGETAGKILQDFEDRSEEILREDFVTENYHKFAEKMLDSYLLTLSGAQKGVVFRALNLLSGRKYGRWWIRHRYSKQDLRAIRNCVECEAHRELMLDGLKGRS